MNAPFTIGEGVVCINNNISNSVNGVCTLKEGKVYVVRSIYSFNDTWYVKILDDFGIIGCYFANRFQKKEAITLNCTCDIQVLMAKGCQCGFLQKGN